MKVAVCNPRRMGTTGILLAMLLVSSAQMIPADEASDRLAAQVRSILSARCLACHGNEAQDLKGEFDLRTRESALRGGESGEPALVPGSPEKSPLYLAVTRSNTERAMPPKENDKLSAGEVDLIRRWILAGASWPKRDAAGRGDDWKDSAATGGVLVHTSGGRTPDWNDRRYQPADIWAFQPILHPPVPRFDTTQRAPADGTNSSPRGGFGLNPIDVFVREKQLAAGIDQEIVMADKATLLRRTTLDLTGLPPTRDALQGFVQDDSTLAYSRMLDRLLASPQYGEQQARHWLDVARYADTSGFSNDFERPNAWRYRDYVIRSFNADKPFDQFVVEQVAGDELKPDDPEMTIAAGFLRMGPWEHTAMTVAAITRQQYLDDVTHHVGVTLLGIGLRCARCHDHKFDPIPTKDYYRLQACFATTQLAERETAFLPEEMTNRLAAIGKLASRRHDAAKEVLASINKKSDDAIAALLKERGVSRLELLPPGQRPKRRSFGLTTDDISTQKVTEKRQAYFLRETFRSQPYALTVYSGPDNNYQSNTAVNAPAANRTGKIPTTAILIGGSLATPADEVTPGVLSACSELNNQPAGAETAVVDELVGRRLALARWIASPDNSLTARVIVNRIWQQHFGVGLVATPNNFGKMGDRPSHPELLDWLATWFIDHHWSIKELHRLIMQSAVYQQTSNPTRAEQLQEIDPRNRLLTHYPVRRLAAEEIRDGMLALSGELNSEMGGPGIFPEIAWEVALQPRHIMGSVAPPYQPSPLPGQRNRRAIYAFRYRTLEDPMLEVFNRPGSEISCERRDATTVATQAFALFNGQSTHRRALFLADAIGKTRPSSTPAEQIRQAFHRIVCREPAAEELAACTEHYQQRTQWHRDHRPEKSILPLTVEREMIEEQTGESFRWNEELDVMKDYVPDLQPTDVTPEMRALGDLCLVLFNSNEFLTVR